MEVRYHAIGQRRKELVKVIAATIGEEPVYLKVPSCAYQVGCYTVTKAGNLVYDDAVDASTVIAALAEASFEIEGDQNQAEEEQPAAEAGFSVVLPLEKVDVANLTAILAAKGNLLRKALGVDALPIEASEVSISFPWFETVPQPDEAQAYTHLVNALCEMSCNLKRVTAKEKDVENEKYAFRCFLLRLGFIGSEFKAERKILLRNLSGSTAFKNGRPVPGEALSA